MGHMLPTVVLVAFESSEVNAGNSQTAVVKESADLLHGLPGIAPELRRRVPEDMHA